MEEEPMKDEKPSGEIAFRGALPRRVILDDTTVENETPGEIWEEVDLDDE